MRRSLLRRSSIGRASVFLPIGVLLGLFLIVPTGAVVVRALRRPDGTWTLGPLLDAFRGQNRDAFAFSLRLSAQAAAVGVVFGAVLALLIVRAPSARLRALVTSFSGVAANLGGIPLAFAFIAALGRQGLVTKLLTSVGIDLYGGAFRLDSLSGLTFAYSYFNVPLMFLVILPSIERMKPEWREASESLGGNGLTYWLRVGGPVLLPPLLGGFVLLLANSFSAYATAAALGSNSLLVPLRIGFYLNGDVSANQDQLAFSLATWMIVMMGGCIAVYWFARRWSERWQR